MRANLFVVDELGAEDDSVRGDARLRAQVVPLETHHLHVAGGSRRGIGLVGWPIAPSVGPEVVEQLQWRRR